MELSTVRLTSRDERISVGILQEVAPGRMAVSVERPYFAGDRLRIQGSNAHWSGVVRHCTTRDQYGAYQVGIRLLE